MKAVQYTRYGDPDVVSVAEVDEPHAGAGEIRVDVRAAGVNPIDWKFVSGAMAEGDAPDGPTGIGFDAAGVVDEVGPEVTGVAVGDAVFGSGRDTYADKAVLTSWVAKPDTLSFDEAAGYGVAVETAHRVLAEAQAEPGDVVLVSGASGGVGSAVLQLARARGIDVVATASPANQNYLRSLGAKATTYGPGLSERVAELSPDGVDAALDLAGSGIIGELVEIVVEADRVVTIADFGAGEYGARLTTGGNQQVAAFTEAATLAADGRFSIPVTGRYTFAESGAALAESKRGHTRGKLIVVPE